MDGRVFLGVFAAICGLGWYVAQGPIVLGDDGGTGPSPPPHRLAEVVNLRHKNIERTLVQAGYDLKDPASFVFEIDGQSIVGGPVAATEHGYPVFIRSVLRHHRSPALSEAPGRIIPLEAQAGCTPPPPMPGARIGHVRSGNTLQSSVLYLWDTDDVERAAEAFLERIRVEGMPQKKSLFEQISGGGGGAVSSLRPKGADQFKLGVMDVAITETSHPVHLVLEARQDARLLWNLHLAPGAVLSGVTLLGGEKVALSNLPAEVPVSLFDHQSLQVCGLSPTAPLLRTDAVFARVDDGTMSPPEARVWLANHAAQSADWFAWFLARFGVDPSISAIGHDFAGNLAVIGPLPEDDGDRVGYHGLTGRPVHVAASDTAMVKDPMKAETRWNTQVRRMAEQLAGGDLTSVAAEPEG